MNKKLESKFKRAQYITEMPQAKKEDLFGLTNFIRSPKNHCPKNSQREQPPSQIHPNQSVASSNIFPPINKNDPPMKISNSFVIRKQQPNHKKNNHSCKIVQPLKENLKEAKNKSKTRVIVDLRSLCVNARLSQRESMLDRNFGKLNPYLYNPKNYRRSHKLDNHNKENVEANRQKYKQISPSEYNFNNKNMKEKEINFSHIQTERASPRKNNNKTAVSPNIVDVFQRNSKFKFDFLECLDNKITYRLTQNISHASIRTAKNIYHNSNKSQNSLPISPFQQPFETKS